MFSMICAIRFSGRVVEYTMNQTYPTIEEAKKDAETNLMIIAYRIFDKSGYRVYSQKISKEA